MLDFRAALFQHVQRLSLAQHDASGTSDTTYRVQYDAPAIQGLTLWGIIPLATAVVTMVGMIAVIGQISVSLAFVAFAVSPILVLLTALHSPVLRRRWERIKTGETSTLSIIQEVFGAIRVVKAFGQEEHELSRFVGQSIESARDRLRVVLMECSLGLSTGLVIGFGTGLVLVLGVQEVASGHLTIGNLLLVMAYVGQLYGPLQTIGRQIAEQQGALVSARRSFEILNSVPAVSDIGNRPLARAVGAVEFCNVSFSYSPEMAVIENLSLDVAPGTSVGIAGPTGSGKTTLLNLLMRFYDPSSGVILLDGVDVKEYRLSHLRAQFSIVLQDPLVFSTSIANNIAYGSPGASEDEIVAAARAASAHDLFGVCRKGTTLYR